ncbi:MAG: rRNA pseudouridine synthase [Holosporales bacterium]|jgi:23S rRNA pseudouridine2605 synthase|nr:rRNA pseudouridine synthase [Holosporales bacterium]
MDELVRLNKTMAMLGICSRREADVLIKNCEVKINGQVQNEIGVRISKTDIISVRDRNYSLKRNVSTPRVWLYYKKRGFITSHKDEKNRPTIFDDVKDRIKGRVISIGRLDLNSEGLILLTNNSEFARFAESPKTAWKRVYRVRVFGQITDKIVCTLRDGIIIEGINYAPIKVTISSSGSRNMWCECVLSEGKNREIRKIFEHFGIIVNRLIRYKYGPYDIGNMAVGEVKEIFEIYRGVF